MEMFTILAILAGQIAISFWFSARLEGLGGRVGFGSGVGFDGAVALVGAPGVDRGTGAVYRFTFHELSGWRVAQTSVPPGMGGPGSGVITGLLSRRRRSQYLCR